MREWNLKLGDPLSLTLAADARFGKTNYFNDQIWELTLGSGEPPAVALQTTFGLRARSLRLFPRFSDGNSSLSDPASFAIPPIIHRFFPNFITVSFTPFPGIKVLAEYWIPSSQEVTGRFSISNQNEENQKIQLEFAAQLAPSPDGQRMAPREMEAASVLVGATGGLIPLVFITGGAVPGNGPYPSLVVGIDLLPGGTRQINWSQAAFETIEASFEAARQLTSRNLDAENAHIQMVNSTQVDILTGDPDWDAAFALSQKVALGSFLQPVSQLPNPSYVISRQPDYGFSLIGDGRDYGYLWSGQTPYDTYYLSGILLPSYPHLVKGLLENFLSIQDESGFIDWKVGIAGQRSQLLATPLLTSLTWWIYQATSDQEFISKAFPKLLAFTKAWFAPAQDRDGDGIPEWSHAMQSGFEDHPLFSYWQTWSQGANISVAESPALCAFLFRECQLLVKIAKLTGQMEEILPLQSMQNNLRAAVEISWDSKLAGYQYWDRDSHYSTTYEPLGEHQGDGEIILNRNFTHPIRLLIRIKSKGGTQRYPQVFIHGESPTGQHLVERIQTEDFQWFLETGTATGERTYNMLERVQFLGLAEDDLISFHVVGFSCQDHTTLLPIWAGIPALERVQALVDDTIANPERFWKPYGIPACYSLSPEDPNLPCQNVYLPWNTMIGEGLLVYGYRKLAAELVTRLMKAIIKSLKQENIFRRYYHAETGQGAGERNALDGLAPIGLFLQTLGVELLSSQKVKLRGFNPFPWPVTVKYRGLTVLRQSDKTMVIFPNGQTVSIDNDDQPRVVSLD